MESTAPQTTGTATHKRAGADGNESNQYLEDIVLRQEQKIKYYQKIIQQNRIFEGRLDQTSAAIHAAAATNPGGVPGGAQSDILLER